MSAVQPSRGRSRLCYRKLEERRLFKRRKGLLHLKMFWYHNKSREMKHVKCRGKGKGRRSRKQLRQ